MGSCLTIINACLLSLPSGRMLFWSDLLVAGKVVSWERWDGSEHGRWERWKSSELGRWGRWEDSELGRWERWKSSEVARLDRLEGSEVAS